MFRRRKHISTQSIQSSRTKASLPPSRTWPRCLVCGILGVTQGLRVRRMSSTAMMRHIMVWTARAYTEDVRPPSRFIWSCHSGIGRTSSRCVSLRGCHQVSVGGLRSSEVLFPRRAPSDVSRSVSLQGVGDLKTLFG